MKPFTISHAQKRYTIVAMSLDGGGLVLGRDGLERDLDSFLAKVHLRGKGAVGLPPDGGTWSGLLEHLVNLLQSKTLRFWNEEVGKHDCFTISVLLKSMSQTMNLQETQQSPPHMKKTLDPSLAPSARSATR
jgi:hypothetical protein